MLIRLLFSWQESFPFPRHWNLVHRLYRILLHGVELGSHTCRGRVCSLQERYLRKFHS